jgi:hypothetical protein
MRLYYVEIKCSDGHYEPYGILPLREASELSWKAGAAIMTSYVGTVEDPVEVAPKHLK